LRKNQRLNGDLAGVLGSSKAAAGDGGGIAAASGPRQQKQPIPAETVAAKNSGHQAAGSQVEGTKPDPPDAAAKPATGITSHKQIRI